MTTSCRYIARIVLFFIALILLYGCSDDSDKITDTSGSISGNVYVTETTQPIPGVLVTCAEVTSTTDLNGAYEISGISTGNQTITASKSDYQSYSAMVIVEANTIHNIYLSQSSAGSENNMIRVDCPINIAVPDQDTTILVDIYLTNDESLSAFSLGFHYNSDDVEITAITAGPALPSDGTLFESYYPDNNLVLVGWIDIGGLSMITPREDVKLFSLTMIIPAGVLPQSIDIDSAFVPPAGRFIFTAENSGTIAPAYTDCGTEEIVIGSD